MGQLVDGEEPDLPDGLDLPALRAGQIDYALDDWSREGRSLLDRLLTANSIAHAWQGGTLAVRESDEERVDALVEEVEVAVLPTLDPDAERVIYEIAEWSVERRGALGAALDEIQVRYEWDGLGDLVVEAGDEQRVDVVIDELEATHPELDQDEQPAVDAPALLSDLFVAADRLRRNPRDPRGVLDGTAAGNALAGTAVPFGYERATWRAITAAGTGLAGAIEDDAVDDEQLQELAADLTTRLRPLV